MARKKFTIRLLDEEKAAYEEYRREHTNVESLSAWLRQLADREVNSPPEQDTSALDESLLRSIIRDETRTIRSEISNVADELAELDEAIRTGDHITTLAEEIYRIFSDIKPEQIDEYARTVDGHTPQDIDIEWYVRNDGTADAFAQYLGVSEEEARRALIRCENMFPAVESRLLDSGVRAWYRGDALGREGMNDVGDGV
jgi:hypothetical protein